MTVRLLPLMVPAVSCTAVAVSDRSVEFEPRLMPPPAALLSAALELADVVVISAPLALICEPAPTA